MPPGSNPGDLQALTRKIHDLFGGVPVPGEAGGPGEDGADVTWVAESGRPVPGAQDASDPLLDAVGAFVLSGEADRTATAERLDAAVSDALGRHATRSMAQAAESLARFASREPGALDRARRLITPPVSILLVSRLWDEDDPERRNEMVGLLPQLGAEMPAAVLEALRSEVGARDPSDPGLRALSDVVSAFDREDRDLLEVWAADPDWRVARMALRITADRGGDTALQTLTVALGHDHPRVRREALAALGKLGGGEAGELAVGMLSDRDPVVRAEAARTVGALNVARGLRPLLDRVESEDDPAVAIEAIRAVGLMADPSAVLSLEKRASGSLLSRSPVEVRVAAYEALAGMGTPYATRLVEAALEDKEPEVRELAQAAVQGWAERKAAPAPAPSDDGEELGEGPSESP